MKRYATRYIPLLAGVLAVTTACEHKELCFDHDEHAPKSAVHIQAEYEQEWELMCEGGTDWENEWKEEFGMEYDELRPDVPGGLRIQLYHEDGINNMLNVAPEGEVVQMRPGNHSVLLYNNDTESIVFDDMDSYASAKATTRTRTRASYFGSPYTEGSDENTVTEPDILYGSYIESYTAERKLETDELPVTMHPLVFRYLVRYEFKHGLEYVALARGALAGMAGAVWLNSGRTGHHPIRLHRGRLRSAGVRTLLRRTGLSEPALHDPRGTQLRTEPGSAAEERQHHVIRLRRDRPGGRAAAGRSHRGP